jgi:hypothetical protein
MVKITDVQERVLYQLLQQSSEPIFRPRATLERLTKKNFVTGDKKHGWVLTDRGRAWLAKRSIGTNG